jgi:hypothetical protein
MCILFSDILKFFLLFVEMEGLFVLVLALVLSEEAKENKTKEFYLDMSSAINLQLLVVFELAAENMQEIENYLYNKISKISTGGAGATNGEDYEKKRIIIDEVLIEVSKFLSEIKCLVMKN